MSTLVSLTKRSSSSVLARTAFPCPRHALKRPEPFDPPAHSDRLAVVAQKRNSPVHIGIPLQRSLLWIFDFQSACIVQIKFLSLVPVLLDGLGACIGFREAFLEVVL